MAKAITVRKVGKKKIFKVSKPQQEPQQEAMSPEAEVFYRYFDAGYYLEQLPQDERGIEPVTHYLTTGWKLGLDPSSEFSTNDYLSRYPDVLFSGMNPLQHYAQFGCHEGRRPTHALPNSGNPSPLASLMTPDIGALAHPVSTPSTTADFESPEHRLHRPIHDLSDFDISAGLANLTPQQITRILVESGFVDAGEYLTWYPDLDQPGLDPILHYVEWGHREKRQIHPFFDTEFYLRTYPEVAASKVFPVIDYLFGGAKAGRRPHLIFDTEEYIRRHGIDINTDNPLVHYSLNKRNGAVATIRYFDEDFYRSAYPDTAHYPSGPLAHFLGHGVFEGRKPNASFNTQYYYAKHLNNNRSINAFYHYVEQGADAGLETDFPKDAPSVSREIAHFANPGPLYEDLDPGLAKGKARRAKVVAFYLPQFHAFPENDGWWGKGFTEWRNIARGVPRFAGHYQPRIPRDLGFYDLTSPDVLKRQVQMALEMGVSGFAFYFYWFNRHRLMEGPLDAFVADKSVEMPFMLIWANENWTRRWDGMESEVLIRQDHLPGDDAPLIDCFQSYFADKRYIRLNGRPLLVIYRANIIPDCRNTMAKWRKLFKDRHGEVPLIYMAQAFAAEDPAYFGFDGAIEFPPHKIGNQTRPINFNLDILDWDFAGDVRSYQDAIDASLGEPAPAFPLLKSVFPSWDNNARRQNGGMVFHGATPERFGHWLDGALQFAETHPVEGESIVFVNAWNEWCEGAYLEPDIYYGGAMLNALARTVTAAPARYRGEKFKILLLGHDAFPAGAQLNLLGMAKAYQDRFGIEVRVLLLDTGALLGDYHAAVPTTVVSAAEMPNTLRALRQQGYEHAIANTVVTGGYSGLLRELGFTVTALVHELPNIIRSYGLEPAAEAVRTQAHHAVFASKFVRDAFVGTFGAISGKTVVRPQGIYKPFDRDRSGEADIRQQLGIPKSAKIVVNVAYGDLRKGLDLFCQTARYMEASHPGVHFVWVGGLHPMLQDWVVGDARRKGFTNIHFAGQSDDVASWLNAADVFFLTSREDPYPTVVMEAMQVGLPVVAYAGNGGFADLIGSDARLGTLVPQGDLVKSEKAILEAITKGSGKADIDYRIARARSDYDLADYLFDLLRLARPDLQKITAVVPNYNYEKYIAARLTSIFDQTYPIYEIIVLDDKSGDGSLREIESTIKLRNRDVRVIAAKTNSGSVFKAWQKAMDEAKGDLLWIAEADDLAEPVMIAKLAEAHASHSDCILAFSDSRSVDNAGNPVYASYIPYAESVSPGTLDTSRVFTAKQFAEKGLGVANLILNVSSVLWTRARLKESFAMSQKELEGVRLVGDWLIYLNACKGSGKIAYVADPLNIHRRHTSSVTGKMHIEAHLKEIDLAHKKALAATAKKDSLKKSQTGYRKQTKAWLEKNA